MTVERDRDAQAAPAARSRASARRDSDSLEQLYVYGGRGNYRPFVLAEGIVTLMDGRSGLRHAIARSYVAPLSPQDGRAQWQQASLIDPEKLDLRAVPDPQLRIDVTIAPEELVQNALQSKDGFLQLLEESERIRIFHNASFGFYSDATETRAAFLERCMEEMNRQLEDEQERLESTFRRRLDQLRERSEREQRELDAQEQEEGGRKGKDAQEVNVAWGQTLYNITSGRPAAVADETVSAREVDYLDNIAQIQRAWDKELKVRRDDLTAKAQSIEEIAVVPARKNIEVTRYLILWAANLP